jgi:Mg-chelatase subunit ChlD
MNTPDPTRIDRGAWAKRRMLRASITPTFSLAAAPCALRKRRPGDPATVSPSAAALSMQGLPPDTLRFPAPDDAETPAQWAARTVQTVETVIGAALSEAVGVIVAPACRIASNVETFTAADRKRPLAILSHEDLAAAQQAGGDSAAADLLMRRVIHATGLQRTDKKLQIGRTLSSLHAPGYRGNDGQTEADALVAWTFAAVSAVEARTDAAARWAGWRPLWDAWSDSVAEANLGHTAADEEASMLSRAVASAVNAIIYGAAWGIPDPGMAAVRGVVEVEARRRRVPADLWRWAEDLVGRLRAALPEEEQQTGGDEQQQTGGDGDPQPGDGDPQQQPGDGAGNGNGNGHPQAGDPQAGDGDPQAGDGDPQPGNGRHPIAADAQDRDRARRCEGQPWREEDRWSEPTAATHCLPDAGDIGDTSRDRVTRPVHETLAEWRESDWAGKGGTCVPMLPVRFQAAPDGADDATDRWAAHHTVIWSQSARASMPSPARTSPAAAAVAKQVERLAWSVVDPLRNERGRRSGRLDPTRLSRTATHPHDPRCYSRRPERAEDRTAVLLLVDCSGSMGHYGMLEAQAVAHGMLQGLQAIPRCDVRVIGHHQTYTTRLSDCGGDPDRIDTLAPAGRNADGVAIRHAVERWEAETPQARDRLLVVLSDGQPNGGSDYRGPAALRHVGRVVRSIRSRGTRVLGVGFGDLGESDARLMYGPGRFVIVPSGPVAAAGDIARAIARTVEGDA